MPESGLTSPSAFTCLTPRSLWQFSAARPARSSVRRLEHDDAARVDERQLDLDAP